MQCSVDCIIMDLAALKTTENILESSWWTGELVQAGVAACGKADSFLKASHITQHDEPTRWQLVSCTYNNIGKAHQEHVKSTEPNTEQLNPWGCQTGTQFSRKLQVMVHCHAAVCTIYPVWQLPAWYPVIDEACTLVFHLWPLPLCMMGISSPSW